MANNTVDIIIRTITDQSQKSVNALKNSYTELKSGLDLVGRGLGVVFDIARRTTGAYMEQAETVRTLSQFTGATATDTSKLIEIFDDAGVSSDSLKTAMRTLADKGLAPNVKTIAELSDQYNALSTETERVQFLTDTFGARGAELGKVFEKTGAQILEAGENISNAMTEEDIRNAEEMRKAMDELNDAGAALNNTIQRKLIPGWAAWLGTLKATQSIGKSVADFIGNRLSLAIHKSTTNTKEAYKATKANSEAIQQASNDYYTYSQRAYEAAQAVEDFTYSEKLATDATEAANFAVSGQLGQTYESFADTVTNLRNRSKELRDEIELLISQGYSPTGKKVMDLKQELWDLEGAYDESRDAMQKATAEMIYQQAVAAGLSGTALLELGRSLGVVSESDYNLITAAQKLDDKLKETGDIEAYKDAMLRLYDAAKDGALTAQEVKDILDSMDGKVVNTTVNVQTNYSSTGVPPGSGSAYGPGTGNTGGGGGTGGVNPTGPGDNISPQPPPSGQPPPTTNSVNSANNFSSSGGGNGITINVYPPAGSDVMAIAQAVKNILSQQAETNRRKGTY